jgi:hypothetical protein
MGTNMPPTVSACAPSVFVNIVLPCRYLSFEMADSKICESELPPVRRFDCFAAACYKDIFGFDVLVPPSLISKMC